MAAILSRERWVKIVFSKISSYFIQASQCWVAFQLGQPHLTREVVVDSNANLCCWQEKEVNKRLTKRKLTNMILYLWAGNAACVRQWKYMYVIRHGWVTQWQKVRNHNQYTVYPKKYAHGFCFAVLCCGYTLTDFPISIRLTSLALWQSNDCPSASKATLMNMDKYFKWIHYERLHNTNKAKHNKTVCIFLGIYCKILHSFTKQNYMY